MVAKVLIFIVLVVSFDLLLGYAGIVSLAHTMFLALALTVWPSPGIRISPTWTGLAVGLAGAVSLSLVRVAGGGTVFAAGSGDARSLP